MGILAVMTTRTLLVCKDRCMDGHDGAWPGQWYGLLFASFLSGLDFFIAHASSTTLIVLLLWLLYSHSTEALKPLAAWQWYSVSVPQIYNSIRA
jgi:hypothetical protein